MWGNMFLILVNFHLIVKVVVLLQLLKISSSRVDQLFGVAGTEQCFTEGNIITYECHVPAVVGILVWNGVGFDCPNDDSISNNVLALPTSQCPLRHGEVHTGKCGPYFGNLTCTEDFEYLISVIHFVSNYEMSGSSITCQFLGRSEIYMIRVGVAPNPPSRVRVTTEHNGGCHFKWTSPNESVGGIGGYNISYGENCGHCTPAAGFVNPTELLTADCSECIGENNANNMCYFEVNTVSEDCWFDSPPVEATSDSPINSPMDAKVFITCSLTPDPPPGPIYVEWIYAFSEESRRAFSGFLITVSDQFGHNVSGIQQNSIVRSKYVNSTALRENDGFVGDIWNVTVAVAFEEENKFSYDPIQFSVEDTIMLDTSSAVTPRQCIDVSINSHCDERSDTFQAQVHFIEGTCGSGGELTNTTSNYALQDYKTCVPVVANTICYSTVIFHNELELNRTERQELVLLPCILETSNSTRLKINSTIGNIPLGIEVTVLHNTELFFFCNDPNCTLINVYNETRCANGTFQPDITSVLRDGCRCPDLPLPLWSIILIVIVGSALVIAGCSCLIAGCYRYYRKHSRQYATRKKQKKESTDEPEGETTTYNIQDELEGETPSQDPTSDFDARYRNASTLSETSFCEVTQQDIPK